MLGRVLVIVILLAALLALPKIWPMGFDQPPVVAEALLALAAFLAFLRARRQG